VKPINYIIFVIFCFSIIGFTISPVLSNQASINAIGEIGSFNLSETDSKLRLFNGYFQAYDQNIIWNLTIHSDSNSSSNLDFSLYNPIGVTTVQNLSQFTLIPGETLTMSINHASISRSGITCSCEVSPLNFYYELTNTSGSVSGNFILLNTAFTLDDLNSDTETYTSPELTSVTDQPIVESTDIGILGVIISLFSMIYIIRRRQK
jgi:hypothetical protein